MKSLIQAVVVAAALAAPVAVFAQSNAPVTRAQVRAELVQLEEAGYNPAAADDATYPPTSRLLKPRWQHKTMQPASAMSPMARRILDARPSRRPTGTRCTAIRNTLMVVCQQDAEGIWSLSTVP